MTRILKSSIYEEKPKWAKKIKTSGGIILISDPPPKDYQGLYQQITSKLNVDLETANIGVGSSQIGTITVESIEDTVLKILKKHGIYSKPSDVSILNNIHLEKTFTLDEVIKTIDSMETRLNVNVHGIWENRVEDLIDKNKLIEQFKNKI